MADDVLLNKAAAIERCLKRVEEENGLSLPILRAILENRLGDFRDFVRTILSYA